MLLTASFAPSYAGANGPIFSRGAMLTAALAKASGAAPTIVGKPSEAALEAIRHRLGLPTDGLLVMGDDVTMDVALGKLGGAQDDPRPHRDVGTTSTVRASPRSSARTRWSTASASCSTGSDGG